MEKKKKKKIQSDTTNVFGCLRSPTAHEYRFDYRVACVELRVANPALSQYRVGTSKKWVELKVRVASPTTNNGRRRFTVLVSRVVHVCI